MVILLKSLIVVIYGAKKSGKEKWEQVIGLGGVVYNGHLEVINCCSVGELVKTNPADREDWRHSYNFARILRGNGATGNFENCYYKESIVDGVDVKANENTIPITKETAQTALNSLNQYVEEHKNDYYEDYGVQLVNWKMGTNGYPTLDLKY